MSIENLPEHTVYPTLALGHSPASCAEISIVGLQVKVYGLKEVANSTKPIAAVVCLSHYVTHTSSSNTSIHRGRISIIGRRIKADEISG